MSKMYYINGVFTIITDIRYNVIPMFLAAMIQNRLSRFGYAPSIELRADGRVQIRVYIQETAACFEQVKSELEQITEVWK